MKNLRDIMGLKNQFKLQAIKNNKRRRMLMSEVCQLIYLKAKRGGEIPCKRTKCSNCNWFISKDEAKRLKAEREKDEKNHSYV
jgi:hypothetical protein